MQLSEGFEYEVQIDPIQAREVRHILRFSGRTHLSGDGPDFCLRVSLSAELSLYLLERGVKPTSIAVSYSDLSLAIDCLSGTATVDQWDLNDAADLLAAAVGMSVEKLRRLRRAVSTGAV